LVASIRVYAWHLLEIGWIGALVLGPPYIEIHRYACESLKRQYRNRCPAIDGTMSGASKYEFSTSALSFQGTSSMHALITLLLFGLNRFDADVCVQSANKHKVWPLAYERMIIWSRVHTSVLGK
jgi:hypothetical protein